jgi:membrane-bound lytic murein transglycosylase D
MSNANSAIVRMGPVSTVGLNGGGAESVTGSGDADSQPDKPVKPQSSSRKRDYRVQRGETLTAIAQKFQCDTGDLAKVNKIKGPRFAIRPGQKLKLDGCSN